MSRPSVVLVGAFDTKAEPLDHLHALLVGHGCTVHRVDFGTDSRRTDVETTATALAQRAGVDLDRAHDTGRAATIEAMAAAAAGVVADLHRRGRLDALVLAGGSGAGTVFATVAPVLPFGVPKVLVSTIAAGDTRPYLQGLDALFFHPVVDVEGRNAVLDSVLARAAAATAALARESSSHVSAPARGGVAVSMFGITTPCVTAVRHRLEAGGDRVLAFHANGTGGSSLERLVRDGMVEAVVDVTTTELADLVAGGALSAGEDRLTAAAQLGVPQVVVPGALDTVNFGPLGSVPERLRNRLFHRHNPYVTLMRADVDESRRLGVLLAQRVNAAPATSTVVLPLGGVSELDRPGQPFWDPAADQALRDSLRDAVDDTVRIVESPCHVNDAEFAHLLVIELGRLRATS